MNKRGNTAVSILIGLTLVLPCVAQTSQAEKEIPPRENVDCFHLSSRVVGESNLFHCPICMCR